MRQTGFPRGRRGYVVDHIVPLACGGADSSTNMQWQTIAQGKAKDRVERRGCEKEQFMRETGFPRGRPGYVVDHIVPLACGGADSPTNMQWQTIAEAKAKDRVERRDCK